MNKYKYLIASGFFLLLSIFQYLVFTHPYLYELVFGAGAHISFEVTLFTTALSLVASVILFVVHKTRTRIK